jgi:hypothetical protein
VDEREKKAFQAGIDTVSEAMDALIRERDLAQANCAEMVLGLEAIFNGNEAKMREIVSSAGTPRVTGGTATIGPLPFLTAGAILLLVKDSKPGQSLLEERNALRERVRLLESVREAAIRFQERVLNQSTHEHAAKKLQEALSAAKPSAEATREMARMSIPISIIPRFCARCGAEYLKGALQVGTHFTDWIIFMCPTLNCQPPEIEFAYRILKEKK